MRAIVAFEAQAGPEAIESLLAERGWSVPPPEDQTWENIITQLPPVGAWDSQWNAWRLQTQAEQELVRAEGQDLDETTIAELRRAREAQVQASEAQRKAIDEQRVVLDKIAPGFLAGDRRHVEAEQKDLFGLAASESELILGQIAPEDRNYALATFRHPIFDRRTQTWGTVHYETGNNQHHIVIRLRNSHSERLKRATQRLVAHVLGEVEQESRRARVRRLWDELRNAARWLWYREARDNAIDFDQIKVLEPGSPREAFYGSVVAERTLTSVLRQRRTDLLIATTFGLLGVIALILASPLVLNYDLRVHDLKMWHNGWLSWWAGNIGRLGSSLFVASFLPVINVLLHWQQVRRQPTVVWNLED